MRSRGLYIYIFKEKDNSNVLFSFFVIKQKSNNKKPNSKKEKRKTQWKIGIQHELNITKSLGFKKVAGLCHVCK